MIPEEKIAEVQSAARISEFIAQFVDLKRSGRGFLGLCPFHSEKTPSFSVNDEGGFYHCFGCGEGGNVFKFLMELENLNFPEAVRKVASHYGITVPESGERGRSSSDRERFLAIGASAARYFRACLLKTPPGRRVADYLAERGVSEEASEDFCLGAAPTSGDGLVRWLRKEGLPLEAADKLGLVGRSGSGYYDRFRGRLMFPIRDPQGRTLGFGARVLPGEEGPKYLNSSDSEVYRKSRVLYGLHEMREHARRTRAPARSRRLVLVEGYLDVIAMHQAGLAGAVATCGTALTSEQAVVMKRHGEQVVALFDGDEAGRRAAARGFPILLEAGFWPLGAFLPDGEDPDSLLQSGGSAAMERCLEAAVPLVEAFLAGLAADGDSAAAAARTGSTLAGLLAKVSDPFEKDFLVRRAAGWTGISEDVLEGRSRAVSRPKVPSSRGAAPLIGAPGPEEIILSVLISFPGVIATLSDRAIVEDLETEPWSAVLRAALEDFARGDEGVREPTRFLEALPEGARDRMARRLTEDTALGDHERRERMLEDALRKLAIRRRKRRHRELLGSLRRREESGEDVDPSRALADWDENKSSDV